MRLQIVGAWPDQQTVRRGWSKAIVRPWNDELKDVSVRLERGGHQFLSDVSEHASSIASGCVFSPALHLSALGVWTRAGYESHVTLDVMELRLPGMGAGRELDVRSADSQDLRRAAGIDDLAFHGFWRIGRIGIQEALGATSRSIMLVTDVGQSLGGYAVVGAQFGRSFLQRIAVHPAYQGRGIGSALLAKSVEWAARQGTGTMLLNVRPGNTQAIGFYERWGFTTADERLHVMKFE